MSMEIKLVEIEKTQTARRETNGETLAPTNNDIIKQHRIAKNNYRESMIVGDIRGGGD